MKKILLVIAYMALSTATFDALAVDIVGDFLGAVDEVSKSFDEINGSTDEAVNKDQSDQKEEQKVSNDSNKPDSKQKQ
jgi:hypothetical protein